MFITPIKRLTILGIENNSSSLLSLIYPNQPSKKESFVINVKIKIASYLYTLCADYLPSNFLVQNVLKKFGEMDPYRTPSNLIFQHHIRSQFHQHFMHKFFIQKNFGSFFYLHVNREKLPIRHAYKKFGRKMLMKLTPDSCNVATFYLFQSIFSLQKEK